MAGAHTSSSGPRVPHVARKPNYDFEKRRREADKKAKKDAKREERLLRKSRADSYESNETAGEQPPDNTGNPPE